MTVFYLCAILATAPQCIPFTLEADCTAASRALDTRLVQMSQCGSVEFETSAPRFTPTPRRKP